MCYIGDGAMNSGSFHESLNMAALYRLPILYVLENNNYAMGTSVERSHANTDLASRAESYAMPHSKIDGQDYLTVRAEAETIVRQMRRDPYPYFLEADHLSVRGAWGRRRQSRHRPPTARTTRLKR